MEKERFSLLLLEPWEIYFEDLSVYLCTTENYGDFPKSGSEKLGRLKICSKSVVFEPKDIAMPLLKMQYDHCSSIEEIQISDRKRLTSKNTNNAIRLNCTGYVEMLQGNIIAPYKFKDEKKIFIFILNYGHTEQCLREISKLHRAATSLPAVDRNNMLQYIQLAVQAIKKFDRLWLQDMYEQVVLETTANKITPLVVNPGIVLLSSTILYFQPYNNIEPSNLLKISIPEIRSVTRRRFMLQHLGCEVEYQARDGLQSLFLSFSQKIERDQFYQCLMAQPNLQLADLSREKTLLCWQNGILSNYEYLQYLNSEADRTHNDLTQYPVFPWVLQDYTSTVLDLHKHSTFRDLSKPVGALNPVKLKRLKERYEEMEENKFLYGSHYSAPGFVLHYLVRQLPHYMLCLNNGCFDKPDRMFNSVADTWRNVLTNMADFKELVPEFYDTSNNGDFLCNKFGINFGYRSDNQRVNDVELPPWAKGAADFVRQMRDALESDYVSCNLHHWIDLIFGYKQRGEEAVKANNLFYHLCYEGEVDLDTISDFNKRYSLEIQIMEFGQIPKQIFIKPHPKRITFSIERPFTAANKGGGAAPLWSLQPAVTVTSHRDAVTDVALSQGGGQAVSVSRNGTLKIHTVTSGRQERSAAISHTPLSSLLAFLPDVVVVGSWDSNIVVYDVACGRVTDSMQGHEDAVTCLAWAAEQRLLITGSWDCCVRLWQVHTCPPSEPIRPATDLVKELEHEGKVSCLDVNRGGDYLVSATEEGDILVWCLSTFTVVHHLSAHTSCVNCVRFSPDGKKLVSCSDDRSFKLFDFTCGGMQIFCKEMDESLKCLVWDGSVLLLGDSQGSVYVWDMVEVVLKSTVQAHQGAVLCMALSEDSSVLLSGGEDKTLVIWRPAGLLQTTKQ